MKLNLPEHIRLNHPERYILTIGIRSGGFDFSLYNPVEDGSYYYRKVVQDDQTIGTPDFREYFFDNDFFGLPYRKVYLMNYSSDFTYIPTLLYEERYKKELDSFLFSNRGRERILEHNLQVSGITILHRLSEDIYLFLQRSFPTIRFIHYTSSWIAYFRERSRMTRASQMVVNRDEGGINIFCFRQGSFLLGNYYRSQSINDTVYYILFVWKQLGFEQVNDFLYVTGSPEEKVEIMERLRSYIRNIIPVHVTPEAHFAGVETRDIPFGTAALTLCEV